MPAYLDEQGTPLTTPKKRKLPPGAINLPAPAGMTAKPELLPPAKIGETPNFVLLGNEDGNAAPPQLTEEQQRIARELGFGSPGRLANPPRATTPSQTSTPPVTTPPTPTRTFTNDQLFSSGSLAKYATDWARAHGVTPQADWHWEITGIDEGKPSVVSITLPGGWHMRDEGASVLLISPAGTRYTYNEYIRLTNPGTSSVAGQPSTDTTTTTPNNAGGVFGAGPPGPVVTTPPPPTLTVTGNPPATGAPPKLKDVAILRDQLQHGVSINLSSEDLGQDTPAARYILEWAASQDIVPQAGWKWTITIVRGEPLISFRTTDGWTIQSDGTCISPSRVRYGISEIRHLVQGIFTQTIETPSLDGLSDQEVEDILKEAEPKVTVAPKGMNAVLAESLGMLPHAQLRQYVMDELVERQKRYNKLREYSYRLFGHSDIDALLARIDRDPAAFLEDLTKIGRNDDTEGLLYALNPDYTDNDIREIFGQEPILSFDEWKALGSARQIDIIVRGVRGGNTNAVFGGVPGQGVNTWNLTEAEIQNLIQSDEEFARWGYTQYVNYMRNDSVAATFNRAFGEGVGEITAALALGAKWLGVDGIGKKLTEFAEDGLMLSPDDPGALTWEDPFNWRWWVTNIGEALPMQLAMLPVDLIGGWAAGALGDIVTGILGREALSGLGRAVLSRIGAAALEGVISSSMEAAKVYDEALKTMSPVEAKKAADETFKNNLLLIGIDVAAIGLDTALMPSKLIAAVDAKLIEPADIARKLGHDYIYYSLTDTGKDLFQTAIRDQILGKKTDWDEASCTAIAMGFFINGPLEAGMDSLGELMSSLVKALPDNLKSKYDADKADFLTKNRADEQATYDALDAIVQTQEGATVLDAVMETNRLVSLWKMMTFKDEAERLAWSATISQRLAQANPNGYHIEIDIELEGSFAVFAGTRLK